MKKTVLALAAILACISASAQLNVKSSREATKTIATLRTGFVKLCAAEDCFYFTLPSSNKFESPQLFYLGKDPDAAIQTLDDLVKMIAPDKVGTSVEVENGPSGTCTILVEKQVGVTVLYFSFPGCAGLFSTSKGELEKMKAALVKWKK